jgi:DNA-binding NarL/FixJ family response regulator
VIRVGLVDDQQLIRDGLRLVLQLTDDLQVVGEAANGAEALAMVASHRPDVVVMDIRMPIVDGLTATRRIVSAYPACHVLILTTFDRDELVYEAISAGASGFLLKDVGHELLLAGIRATARGDALVAPSVTRRLIEEFVRRPRPSQTSTALATLTEREREVFAMTARGLANAEIAGSLHISEQTVKTHVAHILTKLNLRDRVQAVILAYEIGLIQPGKH